MDKKEFWEEITSSYEEQLDPNFENFVRIRYFSFIEKLFSFNNENNKNILKTDGWDLLHTPLRNPYPLLNSKSNNITITDISESLLNQINDKYETIHTNVCKVQELGDVFPSKIDFLIDLSTIDHVPEEEVSVTIKSYSHALSDDGYALIVFWKKSWHYKILNFLHSMYKMKITKPFCDEEKAKEDGQYYFSESTIIKLIKENNLEIVYKKRFGVIMNFMGRVNKLNKRHILIDDMLSYCSGAMCAIIVKKI